MRASTVVNDVLTQTAIAVDTVAARSQTLSTSDVDGAPALRPKVD